MSTYTTFLQQLVLDTFGQDEGRAALNIANPPYFLDAILAFDDSIGGASVNRLEAKPERHSSANRLWSVGC